MNIEEEIDKYSKMLNDELLILYSNSEYMKKKDLDSLKDNIKDYIEKLDGLFRVEYAGRMFSRNEYKHTADRLLRRNVKLNVYRICNALKDK